MKKLSVSRLLVWFALVCIPARLCFCADQKPAAFPVTTNSGAPVVFEIWKWGSEPAERNKVMETKNGDQILQEALPLSGIQFCFRVPAPHDEVSCKGLSTDNFAKAGWGPEKINPAASSTNTYHLMAAFMNLFPQPCKYYLEVEAKRQGQPVAKSSIAFEILPDPRKHMNDGLLSAGSVVQFPPPIQQGTPVEFQLWSGEDDKFQRKMVTEVTNGMKVPLSKMPKSIRFHFRIPAAHDTVRCQLLSSDGIPQMGWGPEAIKEPDDLSKKLYRAYAHIFYPPQVGCYSFLVEAYMDKKMVANHVIHFEIVNDKPVPTNTRFTEGKTDCMGTPFTLSAPVDLTKLNETATLRDNDYDFEPQHANNIINYERFPPFQLPKRFIVVYSSRRFLEEPQMGGPLNRGFSTLAVVKHEQDNLTIPQRMWWHTPDQQVAFINEWYKKDPTRFADLKAYADYRSAFVSKSNAYYLGKRCYESWGAGGYGPYDSGLYGWDEEQMWGSIGGEMLKKHPHALPQYLRRYQQTDPEGKKPETLGVLSHEYEKWQAEFIGQGYKAAKESAAARGRKIKVFHYGSKNPASCLFLNPDDVKTDPANGKPKHEDIRYVPDWFKSGDKINFEATEYSRQIDYFHHDFYYFNVFPHTASMYARDPQGRYLLNQNGRRKIRNDAIAETMYVEPVKIGWDDFSGSIQFLKAFIAKGESCMYWLNGGKYYKQRGTFVTDKHMIPTLRPGNQETGGESAKLGSRPISPYFAEAAVIYSFMIGLEGIYYWDARNFNGPVGFGPEGKKVPDTLGDIEFAVKGLHRISQLNPLFEGEYYFVRPVRHYNTFDHDHPVIRGILNDQYLALAMTNPELDAGETQAVELWYDAPYERKTKIWSDTVTLQARKTHLFQCKLPKLPNGQSYDPDKLFFKYVCQDGNYRKTYFKTGNYDVKYPYPE